jgi:UDPglucose--hexose-1-phosphate uridylyltransferase
MKSSSNHTSITEGPAEASLAQLELVLNAYLDRFHALAAEPYVRYISIFRNFGIDAGASLSHPHSQIIATPMVPPVLQTEYDASRAYHQEHGSCVFCDIIKRERNSPRWIAETKDFVVFAPYASIGSMEFWILPKNHAANIGNFKPPQRSRRFAARP